MDKNKESQIRISEAYFSEIGGGPRSTVDSVRDPAPTSVHFCPNPELDVSTCLYGLCYRWLLLTDLPEGTI